PQHLDALDLRQAQRLELRLAERRRTDAHAVDQHDGAVRGSAADEKAGALPWPTVARDLHSGNAPNKVLDRVAARIAERRAVDDDDVGAAAADQLGFARGSDDDLVERA